MKIKQIAKLAYLAAAILFVVGCQKSIITDSDGSAGTQTTRRAVKNPETHFIGYGYDVNGNYAHESATRFPVIDIARLRAGTESGRYFSGSVAEQRYYEDFGENAEQYSRRVSNKVNATAGFSLFGGSISTSFNASNEVTSSFDGKHIYGNYNLMIKKRRIAINTPAEVLRNYLAPEFVRDLNTLSPERLVTAYGTHVMTDIYAGGKLNILYQAETRNTDRVSAARAGVKISAHFIFSAEVDGAREVDVNQANQNFARKLAYYTVGGNPSIGLQGQVNLETSTPSINTTAWQNSVTFDNAELIDFGQNGLIPIYEVIPDANKRQQVKAYVDLYLRGKVVKNVHNRVPVYSLYAPTTRNQSHNHWLTLNPAAEWPGAINEGIIFYAFNYQAPGTSPVYRYYNSSWNNHLYTISPQNEAMGLNGFQLHGIEFYAYTSASLTNGTPTIPIHRYFESRGLDHYLTPILTNILNYRYEGIGFHAHRN